MEGKTTEEDLVKSRAGAVPEERKLTTDPEAQEVQAAQILDESEDRIVERATVDLEDDGVERRRVDDLAPKNPNEAPETRE